MTEPILPWERAESDTPRVDQIFRAWLEKEGRNADDLERDLFVPMVKLERELAAEKAEVEFSHKEIAYLREKAFAVTEELPNAAKRHAIWNAAMERAAEICDANLRDDPIGKFGVHECARDIRASKLPLPTPLPGMEFPKRDEPQNSPHGDPK